MKKYRPIKLWIILFIVIIAGILSVVFLIDGWRQNVILFGGVTTFVIFILYTPYYIQFQDDKIIIRYGLSSLKKSDSSNVKTRFILISDIKDLFIKTSYKRVVIELKNGNNITFDFRGYFAVKK